MKYYIERANQSGWYDQVHVEIEPRISKAFDTTNDTVSCVLKANNDAEPYKPMRKFKTKDENNNEELYWIINDTVDIFSLKPLKYKHTLSIVQFRYFMHKYLIRNTVFNQPRKNKLELYGAISSMCRVTLSNPNDELKWIHLVTNNSTKDPNFWGDKLPLNSHTKIKTLSYKLKLFAGTMAGSYPGYNPSQWIELSTLDSAYNVTFNGDAYIEIVDINNNGYQLLKLRYLSSNINKDIVINDASVQTINTYIQNHPNATLRVGFWADDVGSSPYSETAFSIVKAIQSFVPHYTGGGGDINPDIYTLERYRYITAQITFNLEIYNYTMWDVVETLFNQSFLRNSSQIGYKNEGLYFWMPSEGSELYNLLKNTYPPDTLTFTQCTWYDALTEIFRFYDAGFKFTYTNSRYVLDIEYYNNPVDEVEPTLVGKQMSHSEKNFNNGRVAYYQNALLPVKIPRTTVRSQVLGVPGQSDFGILLEKPIYDMGKVYVDVSDSNYYPPLGSSTNSYGYNFSRMQLDISSFIVNEQEYSVLDKADTDGFTNGDDLQKKYQSCVLHFARGGNLIPVSETYTDSHNQTIYKINNMLALAAARYFGYGIQLSTAKPVKFSAPSGSWVGNYVFSIEYLTMNNGRSVIETATYKYDGSQIVNQNAGLIDLNKLGLNILGEALKDGEPTLTANCIITNWSNRIKEGDYFVDSNGDYWVANVVNYTEIAQNKYRCSVEFSKNFNALALRVNSDKEKRLTSVSSEQAVLSEDNFIDYIYVNYDANRDDYYSDGDIILNNNVLASMMCYTFKDYSKTSFTYVDIKFGLVTTYDINGSTNTFGNNSTQAKNLYIPVLKYGAGNCVCFEMQYKDALNAGNRLTVESGWFGTNKYFCSATLYTDDEGWADRITIDFCDLTTDGEKNNIGNFPIIDSSNIASDGSKYVRKVSTLSSLYYYKKPNEIFGLNYEWCFLVAEPVKKDLFIGNKFINENFFTNKEAIATKKFYLRYVDEEDSEEELAQNYSILDRKGFGQHSLLLGGLAINVNNNKLRVGFKIFDTSYSTLWAKKWAIVDENNDIYFASNQENAFSYANGVYQLVFFLRKQRIKDF